MNMNYECHITCRVQDADECKKVAQALHWKCSQIDGDPVLGKHAFFYLTKHHGNYAVIAFDMGSAVESLRARGVKPLREKIELIMHDKRY
jgi:hypothetical protein